MARPNILTYKGDGKLQYIDDTEFNGIAEVVLEKFATVNGPGNIYDAQDANTSYTSIGTFTDTRYQGAIGSGDITILSTTTTLYQDLSSNYGSVTDSPVYWDSNQDAMKIADDDDLNDFADEIISYMVTNDGPGTYTLATTAPAGGTWQSIASIDNINDEGITTTYNLYKKIAGTETLTQSPLKTQGSSLKIMSQAEIEQIAEKVRERIVTTEIGKYVFQNAAPGTGTWQDKGTVTDTRPTTSPQNYDGPNYAGAVDYIGTTPATYTGNFAGVTPANYTGTTPVTYTGTTPTTYGGNFAGVTPADFTTNWQGGYVSGSTINYTGTTPANYIGNFSGFYIGGNTVNYTGTTPATYTGTTPATYTGTTPATYTGNFSGFYIGGNTVNYTGTTPATYTGNFTGSATYGGPGPGPLGPSITVDYTGPATYLGNFSGTTPATYTGNFSNTYIGNYTANFTGTTPANFTGTTPANFTGTTPATYTGNFSNTYIGNYTVTYTGTTSATYTGDYLNSYFGFYQGNYIGTTPTTYTGNFAGVTPANFTGTTPATYTGTVPATYTGNFAGVTPAIYTSDVNYLSTYLGSIINSDDTEITTITLWRKIA